MSKKDETRIVGLPGGGRWVMRNKGAGGFLNPPGDAEHAWSVVEYRGSRSQDYDSMLSLRGALEYEWVPAAVKRAARRKLAAADPQCTDEWVARVYAYFRNCYSPDGVDRNVSNCLIVRSGDRPPAEHHLAYLYVRKFFPDHTPREDLIG